MSGTEGLTEGSVVGVDRLSTVVLVVRVTPVTIQTIQNLGSNTDSLSNLELGNVASDMGDFSDNLVTGYDPVGAQWTPTTSDGVDLDVSKAYSYVLQSLTSDPQTPQNSMAMVTS